MYYVLKIAINAILNENKNVLIYDLFCSLQFDFFDHVILSHNAIGSGTTAGPKIKEYQKRTGTGQPQKLCGMLLNIDSLSLINSPEVYVEFFWLD